MKNEEKAKVKKFGLIKQTRMKNIYCYNKFLLKQLNQIMRNGMIKKLL